MQIKRILLKLSGESLMGEDGYGINYSAVDHFASEIESAVAMGVQVGVVIGGGNIFRGVNGATKGFDRRQGDQMGMLATIINAMALQGVLEERSVKSKVLTAFGIEGLGEKAHFRKASQYLEEGFVVIFGGGTGNPFFTTDENNYGDIMRYSDAIYDEMFGNHANGVMLIIDMDDLKHINDEFGHAEGDYSLCAIAESMTFASKNGEICVRSGGDEFTMIAGDYT